MKPPSLKHMAALLGVSRKSNLHIRQGPITIHAFTGSTWKGPRRICTIRVWVWHPQKSRVTLPEVLRVARPLAMAAGFPVIAEAGRTMFRVNPDGHLEREGGLAGPRKRLP